MNPTTASAADALSFQGLNRLQAAAQANASDPHTIKTVARQFEALFLQRLLETMQETKLGPDMLGDTAGPMFQSMLSQQLATTISQGHGVGLADFIARQLAQRYGKSTSDHNAAPPPAPAAGQAARATMPGPAALSAHAATRAGVDSAVLPAVTAPLATTAHPSSAIKQSSDEANAAPTDSNTDDALAQRAEKFVASILPSVRTAAAQLQVSPLAILAQAALETGWGSHAPGNNLFGMKATADWSGESMSRLTHEVRDGVSTLRRAAFRAYRSTADSVHNFAQLLLSSPRYTAARGRGADVAGYAEALQHGGYATDPHYAAKLLAIAQSTTMRRALAGFDLNQGASTLAASGVDSNEASSLARQ